MMKKIFVVVVGLNKNRLSKILDLVYQFGDEDVRGVGVDVGSLTITTDSDADAKGLPSPALRVEYVPCVAKMGSYEAEDGTCKRYLSDMAYYHHPGRRQNDSHSGSSNNNTAAAATTTTTTTLTSFLDDDEFRSALAAVVLVGYDWKEPETDKEQIKSYFEMMNIIVPSVTCVQPNAPSFSTLDEEMHHFKDLTEEEKDRHCADRTMGPGKMAQFILQTTKTIVDDVSSIKSPSDPNHRCNDCAENISSEEEDDRYDDAAQSSAHHEGTNANFRTIHEETSSEQQLLDQHQRQTPHIDSTVSTSFACRICRTELFGENQLASDHVPNLHTFNRASSNNHKRPDGVGDSGVNSSSRSSCTSIFCDESVLESLGEHGSSIEGKLKCPKCSVKVGHWNWSGAQCSCGTWVVPAIQIPVSKVDVIDRNRRSQQLS